MFIPADQCGAVSAEAEPATSGLPTGVVLDVNGTLLGGTEEALPGAAEAVAALAAAGVPFVLASNQTAMTRELLAARLRDRGFAVEADDVVTTSHLTAAHLRQRHPGARVALYADGSPLGGAEGIDLVDSDPDVVVLAGAGEWLRHGALNSILRQLRAGAELVAMHRNLTWMDGDGLALDTGALLPGIEAATGRSAHVVGKPARAFFEQALASKGIAAAGAMMVGDDIASDVLAAQALGMTGVLVRTGKQRGAGVVGATGAPDHTIDSVADLGALLAGGEEL